MSASGQPEAMNAIEKKAIEEAVTSGSPVLSDMYRTSHGAILMDAVAPILNPNGRSIASSNLQVQCRNLSCSP